MTRAILCLYRVIPTAGPTTPAGDSIRAPGDGVSASMIPGTMAGVGDHRGPGGHHGRGTGDLHGLGVRHGRGVQAGLGDRLGDPVGALVLVSALDGAAVLIRLLRGIPTATVR